MSQVILQTRMLVGSILELLTKDPTLVASLNFTLPQDRKTFSLTCDLDDKELLATKIIPHLRSQSDNYYNLSSNDDYSNRDIIGSYPADDPRAGWWLISIGYTFLHLVVGYPDVVIQQAVKAKEMQIEGETYVAPDPNEGLIIDIGEFELERLMEIFAIVSAMPTGLIEDDFIRIDSLCRQYNRNSVKTVHDLLGEDIKLTSYLPERSFLEVASYAPGVYIYSIDPLQEHNIENTVISVRGLDDSHYMYFFKDQKLNREPPFRANSDLHNSLMQD